ncbi:MAG: lysine 5,6-aminomutase subunit alpha, partial [Bacteroidales bacterium]
FRNIGDEVEFKEGGIIRKRAAEVLQNAVALLEKLKNEGLFTALEKGYFADVKRPKNGGKGLSGVTEKSESYMNPFIELLKGNK